MTTLENHSRLELFSFVFALGVDASRPRRGFQGTQRQITKQQQQYYAPLFFDLYRFGCREQASELSVGFDVEDVVSFWPMLAVASSSSSFSPPLFAASASAI